MSKMSAGQPRPHRAFRAALMLMSAVVIALVIGLLVLQDRDPRTELLLAEGNGPDSLESNEEGEGCSTHSRLTYGGEEGPTADKGYSATQEAAIQREQASTRGTAQDMKSARGDGLEAQIAEAQADRLEGLRPAKEEDRPDGATLSVWESRSNGHVVATAQLESDPGGQDGWRVTETSVRLPEELCELVDERHQERLQYEESTSDG